MDLVVISREDFFENETAFVNQLFENGMMRFHLRKPNASAIEIKSFINKIAPQYRSEIALHSHHNLAEEFGISHLHFTTDFRNKLIPEEIEKFAKKGYKLSTSCHSLAEINSLMDVYSYSFLSPVFDSISKGGYKGFWTPYFKLNPVNNNAKVYALGGIDMENIGLLKVMNFDGAAILGAIWMKPKQAIQNFLKLTELCQ